MSWNQLLEAAKRSRKRAKRHQFEGILIDEKRLSVYALDRMEAVEKFCLEPGIYPDLIKKIRKIHVLEESATK